MTINKVFITANTGGTPTELLAKGRVIGQVADGMLIVDMDDGGVPVHDITGPWHLKRFVGGSPTDVTGVPDEFFEFEGDENTLVAQYNSMGVACKGNTAILVGQNKPDADTVNQGVIYRSTNKGVSFTEVHRWELPDTTGKFGTVEVGYASHKDGVWWCGGGVNDSNSAVGLFRSEDDGLTWTFVASPDPGFGLFILDNTPKIISSGRPDGTSR